MAKNYARIWCTGRRSCRPLETSIKVDNLNGQLAHPHSHLVPKYAVNLMTKYADHRKLKSEKLLTPPRSGQHLALLIPSLAGGGVARVVLQLAAEFAQRRHRV